jgi:hypothetical protein
MLLPLLFTFFATSLFSFQKFNGIVESRTTGRILDFVDVDVVSVDEIAVA